MEYRGFIEEYLSKSLLQKIRGGDDQIVKLVKRAYKELNTGSKILNIDSEVSYTCAYNAMLCAGRALILWKGYRPLGANQHKTVVEFIGAYAGEEFNVRDMLRPAVFVPEAKRLNVLLRDFRSNRNHIALVADEYGGVSGMVTIEDVLEQIVGDIEDEYDFNEDEDNIIPDSKGKWRVKADTEIADFNEALGTEFSDEECDTVGGLVLKAAGQLPKRGDHVHIGELDFTVLRVDSRRLYSLLVERKNPATETLSPG